MIVIAIEISVLIVIAWLTLLTLYLAWDYYDGRRAGAEAVEDIERMMLRSATPTERERYAQEARLERLRRG